MLRIEDTDLERSDKKFEKDIIESLKWLGLAWDEGPYRQSDRLEIYEKYVNKLLNENLAYYCFCSKEDLETERQTMLAQGLAPKYSGRCRDLKSEEVKKRLDAGASHVIRFKTPEARVTFKDLIRGEISFDAALLGDMTIAKDPKIPLYNFAVVVDDEEMKISHVIRGEDHIANTPKQILLQKALGFKTPQYAHLPLILDPDRSKMSKRYSATSIQEYRDQGYLPQAIINFLAFLGWHPKEEREIMSLKELIKEFELNRVQKAGAVFNIEKLGWLNMQYIKSFDNSELAETLGVAATEENLKIIDLTKPRMKKLSEFKDLAGFFFNLPEYDSKKLIWKTTPISTTLENLQAVEKLLSELTEKQFSKENLESVFSEITKERGRGEVLWPLRFALSGLDASPGPFEIMEALGKKETLKRLQIAIQKLESRS